MIGQQIMRFAVVGVIGLLVDGGILWLLLSFEVDPFLARALSFPVAVVVTWALNRAWTFRADYVDRKIGQFGRYFAVQVTGTLLNYCIYAVIIAIAGTADRTIMIAFLCGSALAAVFNFLGARAVAFRAPPQKEAS
ncbi:MAG: GtrA family protein [Pseudomonadota bacterium]